MIYIESIASYVPSGGESNYERKVEFDIDDNFIVKKLGVERVSRKSREEETSDLCVKALDSLKKKIVLSLTDVDCLVVCTQNPDGGGIPHTSAVVHGKLDIPEHCACFDISLGCSGYVYSLSIVKAFMEANNLETGLLFTSDPYSKIIDSKDKATSLIFGDAATVTLLREYKDNQKLWVPKAFYFLTQGKEWHALHNQEKHLYMDGRSIFNFALVEVPLQIKELLDANNLNCDDIDLFLFHQASKYMVDQLTKRMKLKPNRVPINLAKQGNTISSSIPLLLEDYLGNERLRTILVSGFGVGLSLASCLLYYE